MRWKWNSWRNTIAILTVEVVGFACLFTTCTPVNWSDWDVFDVLPKTFVLPPIDDPEWAE